ncbi:hypothetical protein CsSME_00001713 [Camellia sinensis var. sinensis]
MDGYCSNEVVSTESNGGYKGKEDGEPKKV